MTLTQAAFGPSTLVKNIGLVLGGTVLIAVAANVSLGWPVAMTLQTLAILSIGFAYGARLATAALVTYLGAGVMGLPVFSNFMNGAAFFGPTAGFLVGFVGMAFLAGLASDRGVKNVFALSGVGIVLSALLYIPGVAWAMSIAGLVGLDTSAWGAGSFGSIWQYYMAPFLVGDAIKAVVAALIVTGAWKVLARRQA